MATQLNLPIGVQAFGKIRTGGFYYVDKTAYLHQLIDAAAVKLVGTRVMQPLMKHEDHFEFRG